MFKRFPKSGGGRLLALLTFLALMLVMVGCYTLDGGEKISASLGDPLPYSYSSADLGSGGKLYISRTGNYNDYNYREEGTSNDGSGTFRLLHIKDDIYAVEVHRASAGSNLMFYRITSNHFSSTDFASISGAKSLAAHYRVTVLEDAFGDSVSGEPGDVVAFLRACRSLEFKQPNPALHFSYNYRSGPFVRTMSGTVEDPQGLWNALLLLQPPPGARGGYGMIGDDQLLRERPGYGLTQLGRLARKYVTFDRLHVEQPSGWETLGVASGVFANVGEMNDATLGWAFFDVRDRFENDLKKLLKP